MRHIDTVAPDGFTAEMLIQWYQSYQPVGSGPLTQMRNMCALIEQLAMDRNIVLPKAQGIKGVKGIKQQKKPAAPTLPPLATRVRDHVKCQCAVKIDPIVDDDKEWAAFGLDSLDLVEIVMRIEDEFDVTVDDGMEQRLTSVNNIVRFLESKNVK